MTIPWRKNKCLKLRASQKELSMRNKRYKALEAQPNSLCFETMLLPFDSRCFTKFSGLGDQACRWNDGSNFQSFSRLNERTMSCDQWLEAHYLLRACQGFLVLRNPRLDSTANTSAYCPKRARSRWGYQLNAIFCCVTGSLAAFTFQPITADQTYVEPQTWHLTSHEQAWPGSTLPARVPCLLLRVVLELLEMLAK